MSRLSCPRQRNGFGAPPPPPRGKKQSDVVEPNGNGQGTGIRSAAVTLFNVSPPCRSKLTFLAMRMRVLQNKKEALLFLKTAV